MNATARRNRTAAAKRARLRGERRSFVPTATAVIIARTAVSPAKIPKWCVHLVGENISSGSAPIVSPTTRRDGPAAKPGIRPPLRSIIAVQTPRHRTMTNTPNLRVREPSTEMLKRY